MVKYKLEEKDNELLVKLFEVKQRSNVFFIGKIKANDLIRIATIHWRNSGDSHQNKYIDEVKEKLNVKETENGIQRVVQRNRLKEIADYISSDDGILPNSIIVSINNKWIEDKEDGDFEQHGYEVQENNGLYELLIYTDKIDAFIVDGQHRLASFGYAEEGLAENYELPVTIFLDLEIPIQAEIFSIINGKQRPVNKSLLYDLSSFNPNEFDEIKRCHSIVKWLDNNEISPFFNKIKMLGTGIGSISQSAFIAGGKL